MRAIGFDRFSLKNPGQRDAFCSAQQLHRSGCTQTKSKVLKPLLIEAREQPAAATVRE
jgi:hypothetical protein